MCNKCNYVALHNHSHYSALDGYATIEEYIKVAKDNGMEGIGLADHGTASGLYSFIMQAQKAGLTPVPGIEFYVAPENPLGAKCKEPVYYGNGGIRNEEYDVSFGAYTHLTVFAYNNQGLFNLFKLTSLSWETENFYFKPRIDTNMLAQYSEGLIVTTGCPSSEVNKRFLLGQDEKAYAYATRLKEIFGENLYVELMDHKMEKEELERILMPKLMKLAKDLDLKVIATNDSHYAFKTDAEAHERVLAVSTRSSMDELPYFEGGKRFAFSTPDYYIKNYEEMKALYPEEVAEEALANTIELMNKCKGIKLEYDAHLRPEIEIPEGHTAVSYFQELVYEGFKKKRGHEPREIQEESVKRIKEEFTVIHSNDFISYFLVVHDYIKFAHDNGIGVGAGRGSIGGSEIAYVLDISNTDPIRFDLLFERFLSPGRGSIYQIDYMTGESEEVAVSDKKRVYSSDRTSKIVYIHELNPGDTVNFNQKKQVIKNVFVKVPGSAPDVDTDFHTEGREKVVEYCIEKYGKENVANIITFGTFKAKRAFKAMCTIYKVPFAQANAISNFIPNAEYSLKEIMDPSSPKYNEGSDFRNAIEDNPAMEEIVGIASELDGRISETGVHACGVIISSKPLAGVIPTQVRQDDGKLITQWEYPELESLGLIKMDFLGLELINTVQQTLENIELTNKATNDPKYVREVPNMRELILGPMDDKESYKTMQDGNTVGIFQLGSPGVRELLKMSKPEFFMEIANITALYRPGPMKSGAHIQYANRKAGKEEVVYIHEEFRGTAVEDILKETYGLLIFQEQIMLIAGRYAGMTPYETDKLRKAIGKKKMDVMMAMKPKFINGCISQGASKEASDILWDTIEVFGQYGFNKSHSVSYAINIYETVFLKTHYPSEFMAALIQQGFGSPDKVKMYIQEAMRMKLKLGAVDINSSEVKMASTGILPNREYDIVFGFSGVKQLNNTLAQAIVDERNENGKYKSVADFVKRLTKRAGLTGAPLESLALAGAFDCFGVSRKMVAEKAKMLIDSANKKEAKGLSLFDMMAGPSQDVSEGIELVGEEYTYSELIKKEAETIGMFISGHPTAKLGHIATRFSPTSLSKLLNSTNGSKETFTILATITQMKAKTNRAGNKSIAVLIDDGEETFTSYLPKKIIDALDKGEELARIAKAREKGLIAKPTKKSEKLVDIMNDPTVIPIDSIELNDAYLFKVKMRGYGESMKLVVEDMQKLTLSKDGSLPYEIYLPKKELLAKVKAVIKNHKNEKVKKGAYVKINYSDKTSEILDTRIKLSIDFIMDIENAIGKENIITEGI